MQFAGFLLLNDQLEQTSFKISKTFVWIQSFQLFINLCYSWDVIPAWSQNLSYNPILNRKNKSL